MTSFWTPSRDRKLRNMWGKRRAIEIAIELGTTSNAVIGRIHRLLGTYQEKIAKQLVIAREIAQQRRKAQDARQRIILARMLARIASGSARNKAIAHARAQGASLQAIGTAVGLSRERVRQIVASATASSRDQKKSDALLDDRGRPRKAGWSGKGRLCCPDDLRQQSWEAPARSSVGRG